MNQSMTPAQLGTKLSISSSSGLSFAANDQTPKERTYLLKNVLSQADPEAFATQLGLAASLGYRYTTAFLY